MKTIANNIKQREAAIYIAQRVLRAVNPTDMAAKLKLSQNSVEMQYVSALAGAEGNCTAAKERYADQVVSAKNGWKTMDQMREESIAALKAMM